MSTTITAVEGRRSGDVWLTNGDAVDGKDKLGRAVGMLFLMPKLSGYPFKTSTLLCHSQFTTLLKRVPNWEGSEWIPRQALITYLSGGEESMAYAISIMVAQRHYSALAQMVVVPSTSPDKQQATGPELFVQLLLSVAHRLRGHL